MGVPQEDSVGLRAAVELIHLVGQREFTAENGYSLRSISISMEKEWLNCTLKPFENNHVLVVHDNKYPQVLFPMQTEKMPGALSKFDAIVQQRMLERGVIGFADVTLERNPYTRDASSAQGNAKTSGK